MYRKNIGNRRYRREKRAKEYDIWSNARAGSREYGHGKSAAEKGQHCTIIISKEERTGKKVDASKLSYRNRQFGARSR